MSTYLDRRAKRLLQALEGLPGDMLLNQMQVSEYLEVSQGFLGHHRAHGTGPEYATRGRWPVYAVEDLREWLRERDAAWQERRVPVVPAPKRKAIQRRTIR